MRSITLMPHRLTNADRIFALTSAPEVKDALGLQVDTVDDTIDFLQSVMAEERAGQTVSRAILNEHGELIGITTLMFIDQEKSTCSLGTWLGHSYWGQGYNAAAKHAILQIAFAELNLERVFMGARLVNKRSQHAQRKLPFVTCGVEAAYPDVHAALEKREKQPCLLNVVHRADFPLLRPADPKDIPAIQAVARASWHHTYEGLIPRSVQDTFLDHAYALDQLEQRTRGLFLVAERGGQVVGFAEAALNETDAVLQAIYLHPDAQGGGIGTRLLDEIIHRLPGISTLTAEMEGGNLSGGRFYEARGFSCVDEWEEDFLGRTLQTKKMQRIFSPAKKGVSF